jgi:glycosyltransferase involved in cell wall biosynthesis
MGGNAGVNDWHGQPETDGVAHGGTEGPLFTVFTPTFNRAHTLHRVFESLRSQTLQDFEWVVIDDGSTDRTGDLIAEWSQHSPSPIRYFYQTNSGKHVAYNRAVSEARGRFFTVLDSDDACVPEALERLAWHWETIPEHERAAFSGVGALCRDQYGFIIGDRFPRDPFDANVREMTYLFGVRGEKWGIQRTEVLRRFPFPEIAGCKFIPESVVWNCISHRLRWINEPLRIYFTADGETGKTLSQRSNFRDNAPGRLYHCTWLLNNDLEFFARAPIPFLKAAVLLPIMAAASGSTFGEAWLALDGWKARLLVLLATPFSLFLAFFDRIKNPREVTK